MTTTPITIFFPTRRRSASISAVIRPGKIPPPSVVFDKAGLVTLRCDIHEHMRGLILVLETPYFAITDAQGHFRLTNLPAGRHLLKAWVDSKTTREHPVDLQQGATSHVDLP